MIFFKYFASPVFSPSARVIGFKYLTVIDLTMSLEQATEIAKKLGKDYAREVRHTHGASELTATKYRKQLTRELDKRLNQLGVSRHGDIRREAHSKAIMEFYSWIPQGIVDRHY